MEDTSAREAAATRTNGREGEGNKVGEGSLTEEEGMEIEGRVKGLCTKGW